MPARGVRDDLGEVTDIFLDEVDDTDPTLMKQNGATAQTSFGRPVATRAPSPTASPNRRTVPAMTTHQNPHPDGALHTALDRRRVRDRFRDLIDQYIARRKAGKLLEPVLNPATFAAYPVTYPYGVPNPRYSAGRHTGEDHACPVGSLAVAVSWGTVQHAGPSSPWGSAYGIQVLIRTKDGRYDYAHNHLSEVLVHVGEEVFPGQVVGHTGATGNVTGAHDHFEARPAGGHYGSDVNPVRVKVTEKKAANG